MKLATFSPHYPYTPAPRDTETFPAVQAARPPSFDQLPTEPPRWLADHPPLTQVHVVFSSDNGLNAGEYRRCRAS